MADRELLEAFDDCISQMAAGRSINDCLRRYPQYAAALKPMLEVGKLVERSQPGTFEVATAQARIRARMVERLQAPPRRRSYAGWVAVAASLLIAAAAVFGAAENSLPGDPLYGVKRFVENARSALIGEQFAARRLDEIQVLLALKRSADVTFTGDIEAINRASWVIAGLTTQVNARTPGAEEAMVGDEVRVDAYTTVDGDLIARSVTVEREGEHSVIPTLTLVPSSTVIATATSTMTPTATLTPSASSTMTSTATHTPSASPTMTPTRTPTATLMPSPTVCATSMPSGWVRYVVVSGDTVAGLAVITGTTVDQIVLVNCLPETLMIIVGQTIYLPSLPPVSTSIPAQPTSVVPANPAPTQDDDDGGDDHGDGSDNSGHGGGENSGSGSG